MMTPHTSYWMMALLAASSGANNQAGPGVIIPTYDTSAHMLWYSMASNVAHVHESRG
jgi:hypothetical protein